MIKTYFSCHYKKISPKRNMKNTIFSNNRIDYWVDIRTIRLISIAALPHHSHEENGVLIV